MDTGFAASMAAQTNLFKNLISLLIQFCWVNVCSGYETVKFSSCLVQLNEGEAEMKDSVFVSALQPSHSVESFHLSVVSLLKAIGF